VSIVKIRAQWKNPCNRRGYDVAAKEGGDFQVFGEVEG
jgi:hypothetical protein